MKDRRASCRCSLSGHTATCLIIRTLTAERDDLQQKCTEAFDSEVQQVGTRLEVQAAKNRMEERAIKAEAQLAALARALRTLIVDWLKEADAGEQQNEANQSPYYIGYARGAEWSARQRAAELERALLALGPEAPKP